MTGAASAGGPAGRDRGSAVVEFVLVALLVTVVFSGVLQLALFLHVRNTLIDCAAEGARYGALADRDPQDGADRARELIVSAVSVAYAQDVTATQTVRDGLTLVVVEVSAPLPLAGLLGPPGRLEVAGHALQEQG